MHRTALERALRLCLGLACLAALVIFWRYQWSADQLRWVVLTLAAACAIGLALIGAISTRRLQLDAIDLIALSWLPLVIVSLSWSAAPGETLTALARLVVILALFLTLRGIVKAGWFPAILVAASMASASIVGVSLTVPNSFGGYANENFATAVLLALQAPMWIALLRGTRRDRLVAVAGLVISLAYLFLANASLFEFFILPGVALLLVARFVLRGRAVPIALLAVLVVGVVMAGFFLTDLRSDGLRFRASIWINTLAMWRDAPLFGHGLGSFVSVYPGYQEAHIAWFGLGAFPVDARLNLITIDAHNDWLQVLAETGLLGAGLVLVFLGLCIGRYLRLADKTALDDTALLTIAIIGAIAAIEFPLTKPATLFLFAASLAVLAGPRRGFGAITIALPRRAAVIAGLIAIPAVVFVLMVGMQTIRARIAYEQTVQLYRLSLAAAYQTNLAAHNAWPLDAEIRMRLFNTLINWLRVSRSDMQALLRNAKYFAPDYVARIYNVSTGVSPAYAETHVNWIRYLVARNLYRDPARSAEIEALLARLKASHSQEPLVWLAEGDFALHMAGDRRSGTPMPPGPARDAYLERVETAIRRVAEIDAFSRGFGFVVVNPAIQDQADFLAEAHAAVVRGEPIPGSLAATGDVPPPHAPSIAPQAIPPRE